jgi:uncharacterized membrane protein YjgN (DUF898 family)
MYEDSSSSVFTPSASNETREHSFQFRGRTDEYFRIWIVNIALTIVTLGIFSAWAKVREDTLRSHERCGLTF